MVNNNSELSLVFEMNSKQHLDLLLMELKKSILIKMNEHSPMEGDGVLRYKNRLCVLDVYDLRNRVLEEDHSSRYYIYTGSIKMYSYLRKYIGGMLEKGHRGVSIPLSKFQTSES